MTTILVNRRRLGVELARRAWNASDLAKAAGVSTATLSSVMNGRTVSPRTVGKIAVALTRAPVLPGVEDLLDDGSA